MLTKSNINSIKKIEKKYIEDFCIYQWAQFALECVQDHPLAILCWQMFFHLYFMRIGNVCIGQQFLFLKSKLSLRKSLSQRLEHLHEIFSSSAERNNSLGKSSDRLLQLSQVYNAMHLWFDTSDVVKLLSQCEQPDSLPPTFLFPRLLSIAHDDILKGS